MEKNRKKKKADLPPAFASKGWKRVDVGDELLLGSEEGGFLELEELTPNVAALPASAAAAGALEVSEHAAAMAASAVKPKKQKKESTGCCSKQGVMEPSEAVKADKNKKQNAAEADGAAADLEGLKAKVAALQQENAALKCAVSPTPDLDVCCSPVTFQNLATR